MNATDLQHHSCSRSVSRSSRRSPRPRRPVHALSLTSPPPRRVSSEAAARDERRSVLRRPRDARLVQGDQGAIAVVLIPLPGHVPNGASLAEAMKPPCLVTFSVLQVGCESGLQPPDNRSESGIRHVSVECYRLSASRSRGKPTSCDRTRNSSTSRQTQHFEAAPLEVFLDGPCPRWRFAKKCRGGDLQIERRQRNPAPVDMTSSSFVAADGECHLPCGSRCASRSAFLSQLHCLEVLTSLEPRLL